MPDPVVACVCLVNGRLEMVRRAVRSFLDQAYEPKTMLMYDTTPSGPVEGYQYSGQISHVWLNRRAEQRSIGSLRNEANAKCITADGRPADIVCHWDSDDWSSPIRIETQVKLLLESSAELVGFNVMIFWDERDSYEEVVLVADPGYRRYVPRNEAWAYTSKRANYALGTSFCYWWHTWKSRPFPDLPEVGNPYSAGEDHVWSAGLRVVSESAGNRMIASIHGGNTSQSAAMSCVPGKQLTPEFKRVPAWDDFCRERMRL